MKVIITGATGMVGEGVLHECLVSIEVSEVLVVNRKECGITHPKLKEIIHSNFFDLSAIETQLTGYDGCFFCLGVSSVGMSESDYTKMTFDLTMHVAETLVKHNKAMVFCYVSGSGTDGTESGKIMWARVKGKTENHLMRMHFKKAYMFRPGLMRPTKGLKNTLKFYKAINWMYPMLKVMFPKFVCTLSEVGIAMIKSVSKGNDRSILEVQDIVSLANE
ncbi:MAG: NAD-dependent epimerase/dehydratase family protein [Bacteroidota bacterium]